MKRTTIIEIIGALFIMLFVYTGATKLMDFESFKATLASSPLIGKSLAPIVAWGIPILEFVVSLLLFIPRTRRYGLWASLIVMIAFTGYIGYLNYFSEFKPCTCGGVISKMTWEQHFYFNVFFTLLAIAGIWLDRRERLQKVKEEEVHHIVFT